MAHGRATQRAFAHATLWAGEGHDCQSLGLRGSLVVPDRRREQPGAGKGDDADGGLIVVSIKWLWYWLRCPRRFPRVTRLAVRLKLPPPGCEQLFPGRSAGQLADMHGPCG